MAIVKMSKMSLVAHSNERSKLLRIFLKSGNVEIIKSEELKTSNYYDDYSRKEKIESKMLKISFALSFLGEMVKEQSAIDKNLAPKINLKRENRLVDIEEYDENAKEEVEIFSTIENMERINSVLVDIKSEKARNDAFIEYLSVYKDVEIPFSMIKNTKNTLMVLGTAPISNIKNIKSGIEDHAVIKNLDGDKLSALIIISHKDNKDKINSILSANEFTLNSYECFGTAKEEIDELKRCNEELERLRRENIAKSMNLVYAVNSLKLLYDFYEIELAKLACMAGCNHTQNAFIMEGWVVADKADELKKQIEEKCKRAVVMFREPIDREMPPTLCKNNKFVSSFEGITDMFGMPSYREKDPNIFVAMFYFLFFGIMMSDAGYGLIMAIACSIFVLLKKPVKKSGQMIMMFLFCGISTFLWGALFGGWFGIELPESSIFSKIAWFNPLNEPLKMFVLSLGMGLLQIGTGFAIKGVSQIKQGEVFQGILNNFSWVVIFIGILFLSPNIMVFLGAINPSPIPSWFALCGEIGKYIALIGMIMLIIGGMVGKKNPVKMVGGALGNVYGGINVISDLLSYSRLFGLGLTTGVIGYVVNMLADIVVNTFFGGNWIGWIIAVPVLIIGHTFNLAINLLGAYVHNSRLQYIEFFGRFYEGSGHAFKPLGSKTKYTYLNN